MRKEFKSKKGRYLITAIGAAFFGDEYAPCYWYRKQTDEPTPEEKIKRTDYYEAVSEGRIIEI